MARKYSKKASAMVERAMKKRKAGTLKSGRSRRKVRSRKQAIAIGLSEARRAGAPCVSACPTGASHYASGGVVLVNPDKCTGCKACMAACPYDARYVHPDGYADKCTLCIHRVEQGQDPACVSVCPTRCMHFGDLDDPESQVSRLLVSRKAHQVLPEAGTKPRIFYLE